MNHTQRWWALAVAAALAGCATVAPSPFPRTPGPVQVLHVVTDPPGATCTVVQDNALVGTVAATPGDVTVRRDFCWKGPNRRPSEDCAQPIERIQPLEIVCRKNGFRELRRAWPAAIKTDVDSEEGPASELSPAPDMAAALGTAAMMTGPVGAIFLGIPALLTFAASNETGTLTSYPYAYRALPPFHLIPATCNSERACDEFFAALDAKLRRAATDRHAFIDRQCVFWPCKAGDATPCAEPVCVQRHVNVDAALARQLAELPGLRAQVPIASP